MAKGTFFDRPTSQQLENELSRINGVEAKKARKQMWVIPFIAVIVVVIIVLFCLFPATVADGHIYIVSRLFPVKAGDEAVIIYGNRNICRTVIALSGDTVDVDPSGTVFVNGAPAEEAYAAKTVDDGVDIDLPCIVPEGKYFVISENKDAVPDSRNTKSGCVGEDTILGKVIFTVK